jgi:serine/threonine protein kinase
VLLTSAANSKRGYRAKLGDLGCSSAAVQAGQASPSLSGTLSSLAPEMFSGASLTPACDSYAFGILGEWGICGGQSRATRRSMPCRVRGERPIDPPSPPHHHLPAAVWEAWTRRRAFEGLTALQIMVAVAHRGDRPPTPEDMPPALARLCADCWAQDPGARPSAPQILQRLRAQLGELGAAARQ